MYTGKVDGAQEKGLAYRVVFDLLTPYLNKWYRVFFDNFFSSVKLVVDLLKQQTLACGTLCTNRVNLHSDLSAGKFCRGDVKFWTCNLISVVGGKDKRDVFAISSCHPTEMVTIPPRKIAEISPFHINSSLDSNAKPSLKTDENVFPLKSEFVKTRKPINCCYIFERKWDHQYKSVFVPPLPPTKQCCLWCAGTFVVQLLV